MSATNRGAERHERDFYETPFEAVEPIAHLLPGCTTLVDAGCGSGALVRHLDALQMTPAQVCLGVDVEPRGDLDEYAFVSHQSFLDWPPPAERFEADALQGQLIISNPPYSLAREFIDHARELVGPMGHVWMLLRLGFLASQRRRDWWQRNPADVYVLSKRPSFTGNGRTDASAYCWIAWGPGPRGSWRVV